MTLPVLCRRDRAELERRLAWTRCRKAAVITDADSGCGRAVATAYARGRR